MQNFLNQITRHFGGWWYIGKKLCQICAELAVHASWYLHNAWWSYFKNGDFALPEHQITWINHWNSLFIHYVKIIIQMRDDYIKNPFSARLFYLVPQSPITSTIIAITVLVRAWSSVRIINLSWTLSKKLKRSKNLSKICLGSFATQIENKKKL